MDPSGASGSTSLPLTMPLSAHLRELAYIRKHPIEGRKSIFANLVRPTKSSSTIKIRGNPVSHSSNSMGNGNGNAVNNESNKISDFTYYSESDDEDSDMVESVRGKFSCNFVDCVVGRELGLPRIGGNRYFPQRLSSEYGTRHILTNNMMKETSILMPGMDKVFCSKWLSHRQVVFGTKCNKLMVFDVNTRHMDQIPSLPSSENSNPPAETSGIHAIEINPSRTLLATAGKQTNDIAIYRLPTLDPICVGEGAHRDLIFDMTWLDDQFVVSGSRDGTLALWRISDDLVAQVTKSEIPSFLYVEPELVKKSKGTDRVRSMCFNQNKTEIAVISSNGFIHCWDANRFKQTMSKKLPHTSENVCIAVNDDSSFYAVGSKTNADLLDTRTLTQIKKIPSKGNGQNVRSVSFKGNIVTVGNGGGVVHFWDLRAWKSLESTMNTNRAVTLKASKGWISESVNPHADMMHGTKGPAIYTHCYDVSGTRLFAAGGPLASTSAGNYIALFQ